MRSLVDSIQSLSASLLVALTLAATSGDLPAYAQEDLGDKPAPMAGHTSGFYVTGAAGANWPTMRTNSGDLGSFEEFSNPGLALELGAGYDFGAIRLEVTYALDTSYLKGYNSVDGVYFDYSSGGRTQKNSAFLSGYWDLLASKSWTPYLGAGIGYSHLYVQPFAEPGRSYSGVSQSLPGYQFKAGVSVDIGADDALYAEAVYRGTSRFSTNDGFATWNNGSFGSWGGQLGVRIGL